MPDLRYDNFKFNECLFEYGGTVVLEKAVRKKLVCGLCT